MKKRREYDCSKCGACCSFYIGFVGAEGEGTPYLATPLTDLDIKLLPANVKKGLVVLNPETPMITSKGKVFRMALPAVKQGDKYVCKYFVGTPGKKASCSIYEHRPYNCRWFANDPDSTDCVRCRTVFGLEGGKRVFHHWEGVPNTYQGKLMKPYVKRKPRQRKGQLGPFAEFAKELVSPKAKKGKSNRAAKDLAGVPK